LGSTNVIVDVTGLVTQADAPHQVYLGCTAYTSGFETTYGGANHDVARSLIQTADGGFAVAGSSGGDAFLVKTDAVGTVLWNMTYGGIDSEEGRSLVQTSDGGYAIAGIARPLGLDYDVFLVKTDWAGNMQWSEIYGGTDHDYGYSVVQTSDGGYAIAGLTISFGAGLGDVYLVKTDAAGTMQWNKTYGGTDGEAGNALVQTPDGGYAIAGQTGSSGISLDFYLVKTDAAGNEQWSETYGGTGGEFGYSMVQTTDGGYAITGETSSFGSSYDVYLVKTDAAGTMQWDKTYGGTWDEAGYSLVQTAFGGFAIAGSTRSFGAGNYDVYLVRTDAAGTMQRNETYGGTSDEWAYSIVPTADGGYAMAGYSYSFGAGGGDVYLVKTPVEYGLAWINTANTITLYRGVTDVYWNYVRVRIWKIE